MTPWTSAGIFQQIKNNAEPGTPVGVLSWPSIDVHWKTMQPGAASNPIDAFIRYLATLGLHPHPVVVQMLAAVLLLGLVITAVKPLVPVLRKCWNLVRWMARGRIGAERRRQRRRKMFAKHLHNVLWNLELQEDWRDEKYAELEAEVEIERSWRRRWMLKLLPFRRPTLRRVDSLSEALRRSGEPLILLEGEPGAGKSVALRHLARVMIRQAMKSDKPRVIIPLYINLKSLDIRPELVSPDGIRAFLLAKLGEANSRDVQEVLDEEFDRGLQEGTWLFLFDSFDEIPDILSAEDTQQIASKYAQAIAGFLGPFTRCRGIVASRDFSSPNIPQFTRFRILRLSPRQQRKLIKRADLDHPVHRAMLEGLSTASQDITTFAGNPMFLGLLCEHMRIGVAFPASSHTVFEEYLTHRLRRDRDRIRARFGRDVGFIRAGAEEIAFLMASTPRMGLTPTRSALREMAPAMHRVAPTALNTILDVLVYSKLGRADTNADGEATFSFVHRRFQEYFSTCVVIGDARRVPVAALMENDQWRETAVTLLQVQDGDATRPLLAEACRVLERHLAAVEQGDFRWPPGCLHLLGILATGMETHPGKVPDEIRSSVDRIVQRAWTHGHRLDKRRAVAFAGLLSFPVADQLLTAAFRSRNEFLREVAFRAAGSLPRLSDDLRGQIRLALLGMTCSTGIYTKRASTVAQIKRLVHPGEFLMQLKLLTITYPLALALSAGGVVVYAIAGAPVPLVGRLVGAAAYVSIVALALTGLFWITARRRGKRLNESISRGTVERELERLAATLFFLVINMGACWFSAGGVAGFLSDTWGVEPAWVPWTLLIYGTLWPASVIWASNTGTGVRPAFWPVLPIMLVAIGTTRLPHWTQAHVAQLRTAGEGSARRAVIALAVRIKPARRDVIRAIVHLSGFTGVVVLLTVLFQSRFAGVVGSIIGGLLALFALAAIPLLVMYSGATFLRPVSRVRNAVDALGLLARARSDQAFNFLITRFGSQRLTQDPNVRHALEKLVGEVEQAQVRADSEKDLLVWRSCPSLAACEVPPRRLLDRFALTSLRVHEIREETLDEIARLVEQE